MAGYATLTPSAIPANRTEAITKYPDNEIVSMICQIYDYIEATEYPILIRIAHKMGMTADHLLAIADSRQDVSHDFDGESHHLFSICTKLVEKKKAALEDKLYAADAKSSIPVIFLAKVHGMLEERHPNDKGNQTINVINLGDKIDDATSEEELFNIVDAMPQAV